MATLPTSRTRVVLTLGTAQTLAWASSFYLPAVLAAPMAAGLGIATPSVYAAFSLALVVTAAVGPAAGRLLDRHGGRPVLMATNGLFALGLVALGLARGPGSLLAAWALLGLAMGSGLYEAAFAALVRLYGREARSAITGITLLAGFASTLGWPLSAWMNAEFGWRGACFGWAGLHLLLGLPLNAMLPGTVAQRAPDQAAQDAPTTAPHHLPDTNDRPPPERPRWVAGLLAYVFAAGWFSSTAMATHLPALLQAGGSTPAGAVAIGALVGPAQVAGRLLEFSLLSRVHPLLSARLAAAAHPLGAGLLFALGTPAAPAFALLHGAGNGILTIAKGTLPLTYFGAAGYGARQGWLMMPARIAQALAPWAFGLALGAWGAPALWLTTGLGLSALAALMALPPPPQRRTP